MLLVIYSIFIFIIKYLCFYCSLDAVLINDGV